LRHIGEQRHLSGTFYGPGDFALVLHAHASPLARGDFCRGAGEFFEHIRILPVNLFDIQFAEEALPHKEIFNFQFTIFK